MHPQKKESSMKALDLASPMFHKKKKRGMVIKKEQNGQKKVQNKKDSKKSK